MGVGINSEKIFANLIKFTAFFINQKHRKCSVNTVNLKGNQYPRRVQKYLKSQNER